MTHNAQYRLAARTDGLPKRSDWLYTEEPGKNTGKFVLAVS